MADVFAAIEATWPAAEVRTCGPWQIRDGQGGGSRVSAATPVRTVTDADLPAAEAAMAALDQTPLFMVRDGDAAFDAVLAQAGYAIKDPVNVYAAPTETLTTDRPPPVTAFTVWPPLQAQREIWSAGGIGPARLAVMDRAAGPKTGFLGRLNDTPAATMFVGSHDGVAMIHALEVAAAFRKQGLGRHMTRAAAFWARDQGLGSVALLCTKANVAANRLYASLGMQVVGQYHYRIKT